MSTQPDPSDITRRLASMALARTRPAAVAEHREASTVTAPDAREATAA